MSTMQKKGHFMEVSQRLCSSVVGVLILIW